jgi:hypothetical protein
MYNYSLIMCNGGRCCCCCCCCCCGCCQGMGEPLSNYDAVMAAVRLMAEPRVFGISRRHITVSTVGIIPRIRQMAADMQVRAGTAISKGCLKGCLLEHRARKCMLNGLLYPSWPVKGSSSSHDVLLCSAISCMSPALSCVWFDWCSHLALARPLAGRPSLRGYPLCDAVCCRGSAWRCLCTPHHKSCASRLCHLLAPIRWTSCWLLLLITSPLRSSVCLWSM